MLLVRQVFQAKYGRGDELVELFKEWHRTADLPNKDRARILTDATGRFFTVVTEYEVENFAEWEQSFSRMMGTPEMESWFQRMTDVTEGGSREFYNIVQ